MCGFRPGLVLGRRVRSRLRALCRRTCMFGAVSMSWDLGGTGYLFFCGTRDSEFIAQFGVGYTLPTSVKSNTDKDSICRYLSSQRYPRLQHSEP